MTVPLTKHTKQLKFQYGDESIHFDVQYRDNTKNKVLIKVHPDCNVVVQSPIGKSDDEIINAVRKRSSWINKQIKTFRSQLTHITPRRYVSGESHRYLGKQYLLKVIVGSDLKPAVKLLRGKFEVTVRQSDAKVVQALLHNWYKARAKEVFQRRLSLILDKTLWVKEAPPIRILTMQTQWGSCSPKGRLTLNPLLVKAPTECIDYVILHELCHLVEHNHSEKFYRLMTKVMFSWEITKQKLDMMAEAIFSA
jgi:hypothetical protein